MITSGKNQTLEWGQGFERRIWAIEGAHGQGPRLAEFLLARGEQVVDVPVSLSAQVRALSRGGPRTTDAIDALATGLSP